MRAYSEVIVNVPLSWYRYRTFAATATSRDRKPPYHDRCQDLRLPHVCEIRAYR